MSVFDGTNSSSKIGFDKWSRGLEGEGDIGKLILLNFFEENRIPKVECQVFIDKTLDNFVGGDDPIGSYRKTIIDENLLLLLTTNESEIPKDGLHLASLRYLVEKGFIDLPVDEKPPKEISLIKPLGTGKWFVWVTFKESIDFEKSSAVDIRNLLGLPTTKNDYLYYFPIQLLKSCYIPSVFDAFGRPPYRPVSEEENWGVTRNLLDDSPGAPELLIMPLQALSGSPTGYMVDSKINLPPPMGYIEKRLSYLMSNSEYLHWREKCLTKIF